MITKDEIYLELIRGGASGVGWAIGSIIMLIIIMPWIQKYFGEHFDKIEHLIGNIKK